MKGTRGILLALAVVTAVPACMVSGSARVRGGAVVVYEEPPEPRVEVELTNTRPGFVWVRGRWRGQPHGASGNCRRTGLTPPSP